MFRGKVTKCVTVQNNYEPNCAENTDIIFMTERSNMKFPLVTTPKITNCIFSLYVVSIDDPIKLLEIGSKADCPKHQAEHRKTKKINVLFLKRTFL